MKSGLYDPEGKNIFDEPVKNYLQMYLNTYKIEGTIDIVPQDDLENAKAEIIHTLNKITILKNTISLLSESSLDLYPATYIEVEVLDAPSPSKKGRTKELRLEPLQKSQEDHASYEINDGYVKNMLNFTQLVDSIEEPIGTVLKTSMAWHADGNRQQSGLGRFVSYWASIELLGEYFYKNLNPKLIGKMNRSTKKERILKKLSNDLSKDIFPKIRDCYFLINPPIKEKLCSFLNLISNSDEWERELFSPDADTNKSLYTIRNDIAHGSISEHDFEKVASLKKRLADMGNISRKVVLITLDNIEKLVLKS